MSALLSQKYRKIVRLMLFALLAAAFGCSRTSIADTQIKSSPTPEVKMPQNDSQKIFDDLRSQALKVKTEDLGLNLLKEKTVVYGVVMDWDMPEGVATLVAFSTGDASLYNTRGGGVVGGVGHDNVQKAAKNLIQKAQDYVKRSKPTEEVSLPQKNGVRFYLLTNKGRFSFEEKMENFEDQTSPWYSFFEDANKVITELTVVAGVADR